MVWLMSASPTFVLLFCSGMLNAGGQPIPTGSYMFPLTEVTATFYFWHKEIQKLLFSSVNMLQHLQVCQFWYFMVSH